MPAFDVQDYDDRLAAWSDIQGHMAFLRETVQRYEEPAVVELGVRSGNSTAALLAGVYDAAGQLWSVDIDEPAVPDSWHSLSRWRFLQADDTSPEAQEWLPGRCDVLFIDTSHEEKHTLEELRTYVPRVTPGGIVLMHDTEWLPPAKPKVPPSMLSKPGGPVTAALDTFCAERGLHWINRSGSYGMAVIPL